MVEYIAKKAFWNLNMPGCDEHYLVHRIWDDPAYVPEISLLAEIDGNAVGFILYTRCRVETETGNVEVLTFGPLCVVPEYQCRMVRILMLLWDMNFRKMDCLPIKENSTNRIAWIVIFMMKAI